jgi:hypothetical protein
MSLQDDVLKLRHDLADIILRLNSIRAVAGSHDLLSSVHGDTLAAAVQAGDIIFGNATPAWARRAKQNNGDILTLVVGYPQWQPPAAITVTEAHIQFYDEFADASRYWAWYDQGTGVARTIIESGSVLTIATTAGTTSDWWTAINSCPKAIIGLPGFPCEVITKMNSYTVNNQTHGGMFLSRGPATGSPSADSAIWIVRVKDTGAGFDGYAVQNAGGSIWAYQATTTLPVWFRIRIGFDGIQNTKADFSYSTDGITYTVLYTTIVSPSAGSYNIVTGLMSKTWGGNAISVPFEFFQMIRSKGPG